MMNDVLLQWLGTKLTPAEKESKSQSFFLNSE